MCKKVIGYLILTSFFVWLWAGLVIDVGFAEATFLFVTGLLMSAFIVIAIFWIVDDKTSDEFISWFTDTLNEETPDINERDEKENK